jgi:S-adenosylmethionine/arginine decarboxylase-like enzyme
MPNLIDGLHVIVDGRVSAKKVRHAFSQKNLAGLMAQLVQDLDMCLIWGPKFKKVQIDPSKLTGDAFQDEGGISGVCMIGTSHISIHVWPLRRFFALDVFSCKPFDSDLALRRIYKQLSVEEANVNVITRRQDEMSLAPAIIPLKDISEVQLAAS